MASEGQLKRELGIGLLSFYGLGTILGAGIYVLIGKVAAVAGDYTPLTFMVAAFISLFSALSYAELSRRIPKSGGEAHYAAHAFKSPFLGNIIGWLVIATGVVSASAIINGTTGYVLELVDLPEWSVKVGLTILLCVIAIYGIKLSAIMIAVITLLEIGGLLAVMYLASDHIDLESFELASMIPAGNFEDWKGVWIGAFIAFYAYIGFEDMVNIAEEVKKPRRTIPISIIIALIVSTILYFGVALVAIMSLPIELLAASKAPMADLVGEGISRQAITVISIVVVINGALAQVIMGSRLMYGLRDHKGVPAFLGKVSHITNTPVNATLLVTAIVLVLTLWLPIVVLAKITSFIILCVFMVINSSLIRLKKTEPDEAGEKHFSVPVIIPVLGVLLNAALIIAMAMSM